MKSSISEFKKCSKCGVERPRSEFHKDIRTIDKLHCNCKPCRRESKQDYYSKNRIRVLEYQNDYNRKNREKLAEYKRSNRGKAVDRVHYHKRRATISKTAVSLTDNERLAIQIIMEEAVMLGPNWHVDHIIPVSKGGLHHPDNLQIVRASYNYRKSNKIYNTRKYL